MRTRIWIPLAALLSFASPSVARALWSDPPRASAFSYQGIASSGFFSAM